MIFGHLTVISHDGIRGKQKHSFYKCMCSCGRNIIASGNILQSGKKTSCGICPEGKKIHKNTKDNSGKTYNNLKLIKNIGLRKTASKRSCSWYECKCVCGKIIELPGNNIVSGHTKSCGCIKSKRVSETHLKDFSGRKFGYLKVLKNIGIEKNQSLYLCKCVCGNMCNVRGSGLQSGKTKSCGCIGKQSFVARELKKYFSKHYNCEVEYKKLRNPKTNYYLPYDIFLIDYSAYIEVQGIQHYEYVQLFHQNKRNFKYKQKTELLKKEYAQENGIYIEIDLRKHKTIEEWIDYIKNEIGEI